MDHKKKYLGGSKLLLSLLFIMLLGISSTCYANVTQDYVDYTIDWLAENFIYDDTTMAKVHNTLLLIPQEVKDYIRAQINLNLQNSNLSSLEDVNMICFVENNSTNQFKLHFTFSNAGAPHGVENLDFAYVHISNGLWKVVSTADLNGSSSSGRIYDFIVTLNNNSGTPSNYYWTSYTNGNGFNLALWSYYILDGNFDVTYSASWVASYIPFGYADQRVVATDPWTKHTTILTSNGGNYPPYIPSGDTSGDIIPSGTITDNSGDTVGHIDLSNIEQGIVDIKDIISGEGEKIINTIITVPDLSGETITSGEITSQIDFSLLEENQELSRYSNFWFNFIEGLRSALTSNVRSINIEFRGEIYTISLDDFTLQLPSTLKFILEKISIVFFVWLIIKWWKVIIDKISSGNIEEVLEMNEEEGIVDLF